MKEKINFKNSRGLNLVGELYSTSSNFIIIMSHGFTGDKSEWGRFDKAAEAFNSRRYNVLTFDFSGSGESDDDSLTIDKQVDDLKCAINYVLDKGLTNIGLLGLSLGGLVSLKNYDENIRTMVLWAPVTNRIEHTWGTRYSKEQLKELKEEGYITKILNKGVRRKIIIDKQMFKDRENVDSKSLFSHVKCPVLIIHGDKDSRIPLEDSKNAMNYLPPASKLEIIKGEDHNFEKSLDKVISLSLNWFKKYLK